MEYTKANESCTKYWSENVKEEGWLGDTGRWENNITADEVHCIHLAQDRDYSQAILKTKMKLLVSQTTRNLLTI
jgi:hypothetical protein